MRFILSLICLLFIPRMATALDCIAGTSVSIFDQFQGADAVFSGKAISVEGIGVPGTDLDKVATIEVSKSWKGNVSGLVRVYYLNPPRGDCSTNAFEVSERTGSYVFFVKKMIGVFFTSWNLGSNVSNSLILGGTISALDFLASQKDVSRESLAEFQKKQFQIKEKQKEENRRKSERDRAWRKKRLKELEEEKKKKKRIFIK